MAVGIDATDILVGRRIREARLLHGSAQTDLARILNISFQQVQKYEVGTNRISASMLSKTADFLGKPISWFFDREDIASDSGEPRTALRICKAVLAIKDKDCKSTILALVEAINNIGAK